MRIREIKGMSTLWLLLVLGLCLRIYNLTGKPLWYDEACSIANAQKSLGYFFGSPQTFNYKILYFLILKGWVGIFGPWEYSARILSVIFGALSIYMIYRLASTLYNHNVAIWSAFFLSISTFHMYHSQQVRHYTLMVMLAIVSFYLFVKLFLSQKSKYIFPSLIVNFLLLNTYPYGILIVLVQCLLFFIFFKRTSKIFFLKWAILQFIGSVLYLILFFLPSLYYLQEKIWWIPMPNISMLGETILTFIFGGPRYGLDDYRIPAHLLILPTMLSISFIYLFLYGVHTVFKKNNNSFVKIETFSGIVLLCWLILPLAAVYLFSYLKPVFLIKHLIYLLPPFLILTAKGIESVRKISLKACLVIPIILSSIFSFHTLYNYGYNINWRKPAEYIQENLKSDEVIAICSSKEIVPFMYYFDYGNRHRLKTLDIYGQWSREGWREVFKYNNIIIVGIRQKKPDEPLNPSKDFRDKYAENKFSWSDKDIWLAASRWGEADSFSEIKRKLYENHSKIMEKKFDGVSVSYWKKL